jgi:hypothetical protein
MWPIKRGKIIDLTKSGKYRGMPSQIPETYRDLTQTTPASSSSGVQVVSDDSSSALGFLGTMAVESSTSSSVSSSQSESLESKHLKVKIEDIEYKLDALSRRLSSALDRLDLAEKKLLRNERQGI